MKVVETHIGEEAAIAFKGRFDSNSIPNCEMAILQLIADGRKSVILDLGGVEYIGGQGLRVLILAQRRAESLGIPFSLRNPSQAVAEVFAVVREASCHPKDSEPALSSAMLTFAL